MMVSLGALAFSNPVVLFGLMALPAVWLLVRALPPQPRHERFPPILLLRRLASGEPPSARTPPWLLLLRLALAALLLIALAGPVWNPSAGLPGGGPLLIVVDNGWEAASRWERRRAVVERMLGKAARENRPVILLPTAPPVGGWSAEERATLPDPAAAEDVRAALVGFAPVPFSPDHETTATRLAGDRGRAASVWVSDGLEHAGSERLEAALGDAATVYADAPTEPPLAMLPVERSGLDFKVTIHRPPRDFAATARVRVLGADGRPLAEAEARFDPGVQIATAILALPRQLRSQVARIEIAGEASAGAVALMDARNAHPLVALASGESSTAVQPLRSPLFYLKRALEPYAETVDGAIPRLLDHKPGVLILADVGRLVPGTEREVRRWVEEGGLLIRFAGPRMAAGGDDLVPVRLRSGERAVGGALSWEEPQRLGPFPEEGPFAGLAVPGGVTVARQLLAVPSPDLARKTWARLADGTPIVTAERRGRGWIVLVHTTASAAWSDLVLSGLFVDMLRRLLPLAQAPESAGAVAGAPRDLAPQALLDGFGRLSGAVEGVAPIPAREFDTVAPAPDRPPGLYGTPDAPLAFDLLGPAGPIGAGFRFAESGRRAQLMEEGGRGDRDLAAPVFAILLVLVLADLIAGLVLRGIPLMPRRRAMGVLGILVPALALAPPMPVRAQGAERIDEPFAIAASSETRVGFVRTGEPRTDAMILAGLKGLGRVVSLRTAVRLGEPMALDPERQPLTLFPLVYWPVPVDAGPLAEPALANLAEFLATGGIVVFDTGIGDVADDSLGFENPMAREALRRMIGPLDLPPLVPATREHVIARAFYLLDEFPGRIGGRTLWVSEASAGDEPRVSPILIGGQDWISAWAIDGNDHYLVPSLSGGMRQRELAFRFGVNLVMYALTGTYKADQLHLPALIERLGE